MVVGILQIDLMLHGAQNLKQKRGVVQKLLSRCRNKYPVSAAEVGQQNLWQRTELGFAVVSSSQQVIAPLLQRLEDEIETYADVEIVGSAVEFIHI